MDGPPSLLATFAAAWSATLGPCWSWGWATPVALAWHPPPPLSCGSDEGCPCSCDQELRRIIDLQGEVVTPGGGLGAPVPAPRRAAGARPRDLGRRSAGVPGRLVPALLLRRARTMARGEPSAQADAMADVLTVDIADPQILVRYENDPNGFYWHHKVLLFRVDGDIWIALTPDLALVRVKLLNVQHEVLERRAPFPPHLANQVYAHDPIAGAALAGYRRRAKMQGQLLGVGQVDAVERMIWVIAEARSARFGEVVDAALMDDDAHGTSFDAKGVVVLGGEEFFVQKIAASGLADFKKETKIRTLGDHTDDAGQRVLHLTEAVAFMRDTEQKGFPLSGIRSMKEFLDSVGAGPGNMISYQAEWERLSGVGEGLAVNHVHRNLCEVIRLMHSWDQVDHSMMASAEQIVRWLIQTEIAVERNPRHPDYSGLDIVISAPVNAVGRASTSKFNSWVTDRLKERAAIWKQGRLYRREIDGAEILSLCLEMLLPSAMHVTLRGYGKFLTRLGPWGHLRPTAVQRWMLQNVARRVEAYGGGPADLAEESSLSEILNSRDHYGMEPKSLASFEFDQVKILRRKVHVRPIRRELPPAALGYLRHSADLIEMGETELEKDRAESAGSSPHWDPKLRRSRDLQRRLYQRLCQQGLLTWRRRLKGRAGIFVVKKKDGPQRPIIDARAANRAHRPPPTTRLGSSRCMADLDFSDPRLRASGFGGIGSGLAASPRGEEGDVGDCFYNYTVPELASWFGFEDRFDTRPAMIWDDSERAETKVEDGEVLYPCMAAVCMGWSRALFFASEAVTRRVERPLDGGADQITREMQPAPALKPCKCVAGVRVHNEQVVGGCAGAARKQMHCWLGHVANLNQLCPEAMSALNVCYRFIEEEGHMADGLGYVRGDAPGLAAGPRTVDLDAGIPRLADGWAERQRCQLVAADSWRWQEEHIKLKEDRVALMGLRRHCRAAGRLGSKLLTLSDSRVTVGAYEKGRSSAGLQSLCRRAAAHRLGGQIARRLRYIETDRNPSGQDSRRWGTKRVAGPERSPTRLGVAPPRAQGLDSAPAGAPSLSVDQSGPEGCEFSEMSMFGTTYRKPTRILTDAGALRAPGGRRPRVSHKHAVMLHGRLTPQTAAYPSPVGSCWADILVAAPPRGALARAGDFDPEELWHGHLRAAGRQPAPGGAAVRSEDNELAHDVCNAADGFLRADPVIQFGQDKRPQRWQAHAHWQAAAARRDTLVMATVTNDTLERHAAAAHEFEVYAKAKKLDLQPLSRLDNSLSQYFVDLFDDGFGAWEGRNTFYGYRLLRLKTTGEVELPKALAALKGWAKRAPGRMRMPLPDIIVDDIALPGGAPSETVELRQGQILPPAPAAKLGAHFGAVIAPSGWHETTKTGGQDDSVLIGDAARPRQASAIKLLFKPRAPDSQRLFNFTLPEFEREVKRSRRSGASNDKAHGRRTLKEIQKRGRWASSASVARYEKGALLLQQLRKIPVAEQKMAARRSAKLPQELISRLRKL
ncbi:unnamed protein product [Prorocentrum cordatum]|uniref:RNA-directed RNA polymerase n=1 Tax=Prorocentrum cordatum TaxID=2364126 RepID=A0ABN9QJH6_9DINO|nr:unnamed protein product [Polarella glacialis]